MEKLLRFPLIACCLLLIYTPFHIFLTQWLSTFTGGLEVWKIAKDVFLVLALILSLTLVFFKRSLRDRHYWTFTFGGLAYFAIHLLVWAANPDIERDAALLGTAYNCRLFGFALLAWGGALLYPGKLPLAKIFKVTIAISTLVSLLAVIQVLLPDDIMTHFGYSLDRGVKPAFFIDDKADLPRAMSTLRDPNSLGAYLILPLTILALAWFKFARARLLISGLFLLHGLALLLTFSRSAWAGAALAVVLAILWQYKRPLQRFVRQRWPLILVVLSVLTIGAFLLRDQYFVQNVIFHADENTRLQDSNSLHFNLAQAAAEGIVEQPFGHGPGTAGLVSIQTNNVVLTENYFLQTGYEVGLQGLAVMLALMAMACRLLVKQKNFLARATVTAFAGLTFCALLLHTWSNEAVAAQWWLIAGLLIGAALRPKSAAEDSLETGVGRQARIKKRTKITG